MIQIILSIRKVEQRTEVNADVQITKDVEVEELEALMFSLAGVKAGLEHSHHAVTTNVDISLSKS